MKKRLLFCFISFKGCQTKNTQDHSHRGQPVIHPPRPELMGANLLQFHKSVGL